MATKKSEEGGTSGWTFLSNHAHVLLCIAREPEMLLREVAKEVGITERAVQRIVAELEAGAYLERVRQGRRNRYEVHPELPLRHPIESHRDVGALLALVWGAAVSPGEVSSPGPSSTASDAPASESESTGDPGKGRSRPGNPANGSDE